jgi:anti-sigma B factor antagonist
MENRCSGNWRPMEVTNVPVVRLRGAVDIDTVRHVAERLNELVGDPSATVVVDLTPVTFIDSTGLGALMRTHQRLRRQGRSLYVICPAGPARRVLEVSGLIDVLEVVADEASVPRTPRG